MQSQHGVPVLRRPREQPQDHAVDPGAAGPPGFVVTVLETVAAAVALVSRYMACVISSRRLAVLVDQATEPVETISSSAMDRARGRARRKFRSPKVGVPRNVRSRFESSDLRPDESTTNIGLFKVPQQVPSSRRPTRRGCDLCR